MAFLDSLKKMLAGQPPAAAQDYVVQAARFAPAPEPEEIIVPETSPAELMALNNGHTPFLLDCRESYERRQGFIPGSTHIAMREIPFRLDALDPAADIIVYCAHGHRSFDVAGWLISKGYRARSLKGGITSWQMQGGPITREG